MLYETLSQPVAFLIFAISGFLSGVIFDVFSVAKILCLRKKVVCQIFDFFALGMCCLVFFLINLKILFGEIRLYAIMLFFSFLIIERISIGKLLEKFFYMCYNALVKLIKRLAKLFEKFSIGKKKDKKCEAKD